MPFTFSHPALIFPFNFLPRNYVSMTGLVIGSMTPDFEYFLRMKIQGEYSHTLGGLLWFDLPLGILLTFIFHNIVRDTLFSNLPEALESRLADFKKFNWNEHFKKYWLTIILSVLFGAASHLFWDGFTHVDGYFVEMFQPLSNSVSFFDRPIPVFKIVQHASTIVGGIVVLIVLYRLPKSTPDQADDNSVLYWSLVSAIFLVVIIIRFFVGLTLSEYGNIIVSCISALFVALILSPLIMRKLINFKPSTIK